MSDYGTMIRRIANELLDDERVLERIPDAIQSAIRYFESERLWFLEGESTTPTVDAQQNYAVPGDYLEADILTVTDSTSNVRFRLRRRPWLWLRDISVTESSKARPRHWAHYAEQIWLYPIPDQVYTLTMSFRKRLGTLSSYTDTNEWMTDAEELIRSRAKWDLVANVLRRPDEAMGMKAAEQDALGNLRDRSRQRIAAGKLSLDGALTSNRRSYNIQYQ